MSFVKPGKPPLCSLPASRLFPLATYVQKPPENSTVYFFVGCANLEGFFIFHCCFFGADSPGVKTLGRSYRCPVLFTFYDTAPRDVSVLLCEHHEKDLCLLNVYRSFGFLESGTPGALPHKMGKQLAYSLRPL